MKILKTYSNKIVYYCYHRIETELFLMDINFHPSWVKHILVYTGLYRLIYNMGTISKIIDNHNSITLYTLHYKLYCIEYYIYLYI